MTKFKLGSSAVAALLISSAPALAEDRAFSIGQYIDQVLNMLNQTCVGTGVDSDGHSYALSMNSNGDCVGALLSSNNGLTDGGETGTMGDQTIILEQELEINQTSTGHGDRTVIIEQNVERRFDENNTGPGGSGDRSISIGQNLEQRLEQTTTGGGGATVVMSGRNTAVVKNSNNSGE
jgi:hypothetical protein